MTMRLEFDLDKELVQPIAQALEGGGPIADTIRDAMSAALDLLEEQVAIRTPVNTGALRASIQRGAIVQRGVSLEGDVGTPSPYGLPVEYGRKPGKWPPRDAIEYWVVRKGFAPAGSEEASTIAFLVQRSIGQHGTEGAFMFRDGLKAAEPHINELWDKMLDDIVNQLAAG